MPCESPQPARPFRPPGAVAAVAVALAALAVGGCARSIFDPVGPVGAEDATIFIDALAIMLAIVVPTILLAFWMAWKYRASNAKAEYLPNWSYSGRIEAIVWAIPTLTILFIGGVIWIGSYRLDPFKPLASKAPPLEVQVVALDWKWLFIYPQQGIAAVNQLEIPAGRPVRFSITASNVFNVFFVPRLGSMIYAMPGMVSQVNLQADRPAVLFGQSSHFSGDGFSDMQFQVKSVAPAAFAAWAQGARGAGPMLDAPAYAGLVRQSQAVKPYTYGGVDPGLFGAIATQKIAPGPGPAAGSRDHPGPEVSSGTGR